MESLLRAGARIYDVNTKYVGTMTSDPYVSDSGARQVADVRWDNGTAATVFTSGIRVFRDPRDDDDVNYVHHIRDPKGDEAANS